jgi:hypothetical protein
MLSVQTAVTIAIVVLLLLYWLIEVYAPRRR